MLQERESPAAPMELAPASRPGRVVCGWCNRLVCTDDSGQTRHVTCSDCRGLVD